MMPDMDPNPLINTHDNEIEDDEFEGVDTLKTWREVPPAHYILKIKSFSLLDRILKKTGLENYESKEFKASGYQWKLLLYTSGDEKRNGTGHISLYLKLMSPRSITDALLIFFIYDQLKYKYLSIQDTRVRRFERFDEKTKDWGLSQLISLDCFKSASNGFLVNDSCVFGVEVFALEDEGEEICFLTQPEQSEKVYVWNVEKLSGLKEFGHFSEPFSDGRCIWKLHLYRNGIPKVKGQYMSIFLCLHEHRRFPPGWKMHVEFKISVSGDKIEKRGNAWFSASDTAWGFPYFISLADASKLKNIIDGDAMKIELQIISMSMPVKTITSFSPHLSNYLL